MRSVDVFSRLTGARLVYLQGIAVRSLLLITCVIGSAFAVFPEAAAPASSASRTTEMSRPRADFDRSGLITKEMVQEWVSRWQRRLALDDWKIEMRIVRLADLPKGTVANIHWSLPRHTATIKVLDPLDSTLAAHEIARDTELSVVHELVHLSMAKLPLDSTNTELEEETVKKLSIALLALDKPQEEASSAAAR